MLSVYYYKICLTFASHHFLVYVVYMCQKSLNFTYALKCFHQKCSWPHFSWPTLYVCLSAIAVSKIVDEFLEIFGVVGCETVD